MKTSFLNRSSRLYRMVLTTAAAILFATITNAAQKPAAATAKKAQASAPTAQRKPAPGGWSGGKHCLWRVTNAPAPFYIVGSCHRLHANDYPLPSVIESSMAQAQQFYFEVDPNAWPIFWERIKNSAYLPVGTGLKSKVRPETFEHLSRINRGNSLWWMSLKPWAIAEFVLESTYRDPARGADGLDAYIERKAKARGCPMRGLESADRHAAVFYGMNDNESEIYLLESMVFANYYHNHSAEMNAAWKSGNTEKLAAMEDPVIKEAPHLNDRFLKDRNVQWVPVIEQAIKSGKPTMVCAGAAHFSGPYSVLKMLRSHGYNIEQL